MTDPPAANSSNDGTVTNGSQTAALTLASNQTSDPDVVTSDGSDGTIVTDPTTPTTPWPDLPFGWLEQHVPSIVSDLQEFKHGNGFSQLLNEIENWNLPSGSGSTPTGRGQNGPWAQPIFPGSGFDAGWQSHMTQTMASFGDSKGGPPPGILIQSNDQAPQIVLAGTTQYHS